MFHAQIHLYMQRIRDLETCWRRKDIGERSDKEIMVFSWYSYKKTLSYNVINSGNQLGAFINTPARIEISSCSKITFLYILYDFVCGVNKSLFCCCQLIFILSVWPNFSPQSDSRILNVYFMKTANILVYGYITVYMKMFLITKILDLAYVQNYMRCLSQNRSDTK